MDSHIVSVAPPPRIVFFASDHTGITAEMLGHSLITQFEGIDFHCETVRYLDTPEKVDAFAARVRLIADTQAQRPLVISTFVDDMLRARMMTAHALVIDLFGAFVAPLEAELGRPASHIIGKSHGILDFQQYQRRIAAIDYTLAHDDGGRLGGLERADLILVGVSRSGKTPTSLYLALQYSLRVANYPLVPEDMEDWRVHGDTCGAYHHASPHTLLPTSLRPYREKLFGLTITAERLAQIRQERRPDSHYAALDGCRQEVAQVENFYRQLAIPYIDATHRSVEELAASIMARVRHSA